MNEEIMSNEVEVMDQNEVEATQDESNFTDLTEYEGTSDRFVEGAAVGAAIAGGVVAVGLLIKKVIAPAVKAGWKAGKEEFARRKAINEEKKRLKNNPEERAAAEAEIIDSTASDAPEEKKSRKKAS